jgi:hypothetical protein
MSTAGGIAPTSSRCVLFPLVLVAERWALSSGRKGSSLMRVSHGWVHCAPGVRYLNLGHVTGVAMNALRQQPLMTDAHTYTRARARARTHVHTHLLKREAAGPRRG